MEKKDALTLKILSHLYGYKKAQILKYICENLNDDFLFHGTYKSISKATNSSKPTIVSLFKELNNIHLIKREKNGLYRLNKKILTSKTQGTNMRKALFLDRDGVINEDNGYISKKEDFVFKKGIFDILNFFKNEGFLIFIITNQSGINRGYFSEKDFLQLTDFMIKEFEKQDIKIQKVYFCPHRPDEKCSCRKPEAKMIFDAIKEFEIDAENSLFIGDKISDMEAGFNAGVKHLFLIGNEKGNFFKNVKNFEDIQKLFLVKNTLKQT